MGSLHYKQTEGRMTGSKLICVVAITRMILVIRNFRRNTEQFALKAVLVSVYVFDT